MKSYDKPDYLGQTQEERDRISFEMQKSPFKKWIQFNENEINNLMYLTSLNPLAMNILYFLMKNANNYNAVIVSQKTLAEILGKSIRSIATAIKVLKEHNFIDVRKDGRGNIYMINSNVSWKSYGSNHKFAEFNAKVIFSEQEMQGIELNKTYIRTGQNLINNKED